MRYKNRCEAGRILAKRLRSLQGERDLIVLGIPRGGVVTAFEIAAALNAPLDIYITRKLGAPYNSELAIGAVASDGTVLVDENLANQLGVSPEYIQLETRQQREEIDRRMTLYRGDSSPPELEGKTVILVDDGVATGSTVSVALQALRQHNPRKLILAVPVGPQDTIARLRKEADEVVCPLTPSFFWAVSGFYSTFDQTSDDEVIRLLHRASARVDYGEPSDRNGEGSLLV